MPEVCSLSAWEEPALEVCSLSDGCRADRTRLFSDASTGLGSDSRRRTVTSFDSSEAEGCHDIGQPSPAGCTKSRILGMGAEMLQGFKRQEFQEELKKLSAGPRGNGSVPGRMELALSVQSEVLLRHGLPGSFEGVLCMLDMLTEVVTDPEVHELLNDIDELLGLPRNWTANEIVAAKLRKESVSLTRDQVLMLANELLIAFRDAKFQKKLAALCKPSGSSTYVQGRAELAMTVQSKVLPKYRIPGNRDGLLMMLDALEPHKTDVTVTSVLNAIDEALKQASGTTLSCL